MISMIHEFCRDLIKTQLMHIGGQMKRSLPSLNAK